MKISIDAFEKAIKNCRCKETSGDPEYWSDKNPSYRQCLVTALLANEVLGLDAFAEKVTLDSGFSAHHYFNKDTNKNYFRFCEGQFIFEKILTREKEKSLSKEWFTALLEQYPDINGRYKLFKERFQKEILQIIGG